MKKYRRIILISLIPVLIILVFELIININLYYSQDEPYKSVRINGLVALNIVYQGKIYTIVSESNSIYYHMGKKNTAQFILRDWILKRILFNRPIKVDSKMYNSYFKYVIVDLNLVEKIKNRYCSNDTSLISQEGRFRISSASEEGKVLIYLVKKDNLFCFPECESGIIRIANYDKRKICN